jgi:hypothetical protein
MFFNPLDTFSLAPIGASEIESSPHGLYPVGLGSIGIISPYAFKRGRKYISNKKYFLNIPYAFLSVLIGIIDGDGHISITKTNKGYIKMNLVISLNIRDLSLLEYVYSILRLGKIKTYPKSKIKDTCKLVIHKTDIQDILFPLLRYHKLYFLTKVRNQQYDKAIYILENNLIYFDNIPKIIPNCNNMPLKSEEYLYLNFFRN